MLHGEVEAARLAQHRAEGAQLHRGLASNHLGDVVEAAALVATQHDRFKVEAVEHPEATCECRRRRRSVRLQRLLHERHQPVELYRLGETAATVSQLAQVVLLNELRAELACKLQRLDA